MRTSATIAAGNPAAPLVESFLRPSLFIPELQTRKKPLVLEELVAPLVETGVARHGEVVLELLRQREALGSTGIGKGVAVPHARSTVIGQRAVLMARSSKGVEFDAPDGLPVKLLFLIVAPPMERDPIYLKIIADIVRAVRLARPRQRLLESPDFESMREVLLRASAE